MRYSLIARRRSIVTAALLAATLAAAPAVCAAVDAAAAPPSSRATPAYSETGADTCLDCHDEPALQGLFHTAHGAPNNPRAPFGRGQLQCEACHGPGNAHATGKGKSRPSVIRFGRGSPTPVAEQNAMCLGCHQSGTGTEWHAGAHAGNDVGCADCHQSHAPRDAVLKTATQSAVCYTCHKTQQANALKPYAHPLREGEMACTGCHQPHGSATRYALKRATVNDTCYACHAELRGPFLWEHAPVAENCSNCHEPHGTVHPAMLKARGPFLCQSCHAVQGHPSVAYTSDGLPASATRSPAVVAGNCANCHSQVHGSNHPSGRNLTR